MAIITISRQAGSLGNEIAQETANALGYDYIEKAQISEVLSRLGFSISDIDKYDEKKPSVWQTLTIHKSRFAHFIMAAMYELASRQNVVIVGRGGQVIFKDFSGILHVRVVAPYATRVSRLMEQRGYKEDEAHRIIQQIDLDSAGYLSTYFNENPNNSDLYDLMINTRTMTLEKSAEMITSAVAADEFTKNPPMSEVLSDLSLKHQGMAAIMEITGEGGLVNLDVKNGVVSLSGIVETTVAKNKCEQFLSSIPGIKSVQTQVGVRSEDGRIF